MKILCRIFGCTEIEECYCIKIKKGNRFYYQVINRIICNRCGRVIRKDISPLYTKREMLKLDFFICDDKE